MGAWGSWSHPPSEGNSLPHLGISVNLYSMWASIYRQEARVTSPGLRLSEIQSRRQLRPHPEPRAQPGGLDRGRCQSRGGGGISLCTPSSVLSCCPIHPGHQPATSSHQESQHEVRPPTPYTHSGLQRDRAWTGQVTGRAGPTPQIPKPISLLGGKA